MVRTGLWFRKDCEGAVDPAYGYRGKPRKVTRFDGSSPEGCKVSPSPHSGASLLPADSELFAARCSRLGQPFDLRQVKETDQCNFHDKHLLLRSMFDNAESRNCSSTFKGAAKTLSQG